MNHAIKSQEIFDDIEFELLQAAVRRDELGESIQAVRKFQNGIRSELLAAVESNEGGRELVTRQLQINDMIFTILQQMGNDLLRMQREQRRMAPWLANHPLPDPSELPPPAPTPIGSGSAPRLAETRHSLATSVAIDQMALDAAGRREALDVPLDARPVDLPLIGGLLHRIRRALHGVAWYYTRLLAERQGGLNQLMSRSVIDLATQQRRDEERIAALEKELKALQGE